MDWLVDCVFACLFACVSSFVWFLSVCLSVCLFVLACCPWFAVLVFCLSLFWFVLVFCSLLLACLLLRFILVCLFVWLIGCLLVPSVFCFCCCCWYCCCYKSWDQKRCCQKDLQHHRDHPQFNQRDMTTSFNQTRFVDAPLQLTIMSIEGDDGNHRYSKPNQKATFNWTTKSHASRLSIFVHDKNNCLTRRKNVHFFLPRRKTPIHFLCNCFINHFLRV